MELVNEERWNNGQLPPLKRQTQLDNASETHSENMAVRNFFDHCDLDTGTLPWDRMEAAGYNWNGAAENIAAGYDTPLAVMAGWMASPGHRANILSTGLRELGIGYVYQGNDQNNVRNDLDGDCLADTDDDGPYYHYWTQNFGLIDDVYPLVINREAYETATQTVNLYQYGVGWAQEMRLSNDGSGWTAWQPYAPNTTWTLDAGSGVKTVYAEIRNGSVVRSASDTIVLNDDGVVLTPEAYLPLAVRP